MNTQLIPVFVGEISGVSAQLIDARLLHSFLEVVTRFNDWIVRRIEEYAFEDGKDFYSILSKTKGRPSQEYRLTIDMAKELGMIERSEKGRQIRRYFLEIERQALSKTAQLPEPPTQIAHKGCLTIEQQDTIKALIKQRAEELPEDKWASATIKTWSSIKNKYGVSYKEISSEHFIGIISLISRLPLKGEVLSLEDQSASKLLTGDKEYIREAKASAQNFIHDLPASSRIGKQNTATMAIHPR